MPPALGCIILSSHNLNIYIEKNKNARKMVIIKFFIKKTRLLWLRILGDVYKSFLE